MNKVLKLVTCVGIATFIPYLLTVASIKQAQAQSNSNLNIPNYCTTENLFIAAETKNFWVNICWSGGDYGDYGQYSKNDRNRAQNLVTPINLPVQIDENNYKVVAVSRKMSYILTKGYLVVTKKGKIIRREKILNQIMYHHD